MYFSAWANSAHPWNEVRDFVRSVEDMGWDGFWYADHYMPNTPDGETVGGNFHECFSVLSALAATTSRVRLGSLVTPTTMNHPALIANRAATIDRISDGRFVLGCSVCQQRGLWPCGSCGNRFTDCVPRFINDPQRSSRLHVLVEHGCNHPEHQRDYSGYLHGDHHRRYRLLEQLHRNGGC